MMEKLRSLRMWVKLTLLVALMAVPLAVVGWQFVRIELDRFALDEREVGGMEYLESMRKVLAPLQEHRAGAGAVAAGNAVLRAELTRQQAAVDSGLTAAEVVDKRVTALFGTDDEFQAIKKAWNELKAKLPALNAAQSDAEHAKLIQLVLDHFLHVADTSSLILNSHLDTTHLIDALTTGLPRFAEDFGELENLGGQVASARKITPEQTAEINRLVKVIRKDAQDLRRSYNVAFQETPAIQERLGADLTKALADIEGFLEYTTAQFLNVPVVTVDAETYVSRGAQTSGGIWKLYDDTFEVARGQVLADEASLYVELAGAGGATLAALLVVFLISRGVRRQAASLMRMFAGVAMGDFGSRAEVTSGDEFGDVAKNLNSMMDIIGGLIQSRDERDQIQASIQKLLDEVSGVGAGDLSRDAEVTADVTGAIADSFNYMMAELRQIIGNVQTTAQKVSGSAGQIRSSTEHLAAGSEAQSAQILEASTAIDEMAVSIQQVSQNATEAAGVAEKALASAQQGAATVKETIDGMEGIRQQVQQTAKRIKRLGESSQEIGEIIQLISDISDRTSILALNASIQAAMAGEAGKGFAVVAEEVERLAERSTEATKKIGGLIKSIQTDTNEAIVAMEDTTKEVVGGSKLADEAGRRLAEIEKVSTDLARFIQGIALAARQQARGSESLAKTVAEISSVTQTTASGAKQAAVSINELAVVADGLRESMGRFKLA